uniref:Outer-membrane lipoprotein carrier protein n=1 Tax=Candidatus Kentrum sp. LFY TaxID=2126342 RepID=A0A450U7A2_9GAMM|nr:MAG: outer membrane lipoprotein carrier protein [Candidatus Kentron sp. LFY]
MPGRAETDASPVILEHLNRFLQEVDTLAANFEQALFDEEGQSLEDSRGIVYLARPKRFHWAYEEPYEQTIVADGKRVWFYDKDIAQVIVKPWNSFSPDTPIALLTMARPLEEIFVAREIAPEEMAMGARSSRQWVRLTPKSSEATFVDIRLGLGKETVEVMELSDSFGQLTRLTFSKVVTNPKLDPKIFSFTPPEGTDVVGLDVEGKKSHP